MKTLITIILCFISLGAFAQMQVDKKIEMTGASSADKKIEGIEEVVNDADAANKVYVDTAIANRASSGGSTPPWTMDNYRYPVSLAGVPSVRIRVTSSSTYTVPAGKMLYVTQVYMSGGVYLRIDNKLVAYGATNTAQYDGITNPFILGPGDVLSSSSSADLQGFLVDNDPSLTVVTRNNLYSSTYTVPAGKKLVLLNCYINSSSSILSIDSWPILKGNITYGDRSRMTVPMVFNSGGVIGIIGADNNTTFNGYLMDE